MNQTRCSEPGCRRKPHARGLCQKHYDELRKSRGGGRTGPAPAGTRPAEPAKAAPPAAVAPAAGLPLAMISLPPESAARDKVCCVAGCPNPHHAKGYCKMHYGQLRRHGSIEPVVAGAGGAVQATVLSHEQRLIEIKKRHEILKREIASINEALDSESTEVDEPEPEEE